MELFGAGLLSRSMRSRVRIFQALKTLMEYEDFDRISVKHICQVAHTGKTTFYAHFQDKYDIIQWFTNLFYDIGVARIGRSLTWEQGHRISTAGYLNYQPMLRKAFQSMDYNGIATYSPRRREDNLFETLTDYKHVEVTPLIRAQVISLAAGETAYFHRYLAEIDSPNLEDVVAAFMSIIPPQLHELLKEPVSPKKDNINEEMMNVQFIIQMLASPIG